MYVERDERTCGLKSLWAFKRLLPYCFETIQSDISCVALRTADHTHTHRPSNKDSNTKLSESRPKAMTHKVMVKGSKARREKHEDR